MASNCFFNVNYFIDVSLISYIVLCVLSPIHSYSDPRNEFSTHEVVVPIVYQNNVLRNILENEILDSGDINIKINAFNKTFTIFLKRNTHLIPSNYFEKHHENGQYINNYPHSKKPNDCHLKGHLINSSQSTWAAVSTCNNTISGVFNDGFDVYYIHPTHDRKAITLFRHSDMKSLFRCGFNNDSKLDVLNRYKRAVYDPYNSNSSSRYVELIIVNDYKVYEENKKDRSAVFERSKRIANIVNALYNQLNIYITLVGVIVWTDSNEITLSSDGDQTLTNFLHYRRERLVIEHPNDNAQLITGASFDGGVVGKALKGSICTYEYSGGVNTDHSQIIGLVATTVAHELGHNFGMEHDSDSCKCQSDKCIMAPSSSSVSPKYWSACSREYLEHSFKHGMDHCLRNKPKQLMDPICGNGFLEEGEQCDCGLKSTCDNNCCNASTCQLMSGASCATGTCCDMTTCNVIEKERQKVCRKSSGDCDLAETCNGESEFCPEDLIAQDGTSCNGGVAYCFDGKCNSHESQCELLWGETGKVSDYKCYEQNTKGNANGNCGYSRTNQTYKRCFISDVICGRLHCFYQNERLEYGTESAAILSRSFINIKNKMFTCRSAMIDLGLDSVDPGLVPNGAKCGTNEMCVNQKCVSVNFYRKKNACVQNCNNNGLCDNKGNCHCFQGFAQPYCEHSFPGGYFFTVAMYIIFLCILPLTAITAFIIYTYHDNIKTWWLMQTRKSAIKSRAKQISHRKPPRLPVNFNAEALEISNPIPIDCDDNNILITSTFPRSTLKNSVKQSLKVGGITAPITNNATFALKPVRPAPPPPINIALSRSSSTRSSSRSGRNSIHYARPTQPPPRPPPPPRPKQNCSELDVKESNTSTNAENKSKPPFVSLLKQSPQTIANKSLIHNELVNKDVNTNVKQISVASLAKRFETHIK